MSKYLLEIGVEELPYKFITSVKTQLEDSFKQFLDSNKVEFGSIEVLTTPRRLTVIIDQLADSQPDSTKVFKGPIKKIAFDEDGNLTKAGEGFAKKNGLNPEDLYVEDDYVYAKLEVKGQSTKDLIASNIQSIILKLQGSHFMRWSTNEEKFSRPIRWVVSLYNDEELKVRVIDIESSRVSRGHRSYEGEVVINSIDEYKDALRNAYVIVSQEERKSRILELANAEAAKIGATTRIPDEVTITVMETHQRYFALVKDGKLTNNFITMANYIGNEFENIKAGNLRVIKARLDDAVFFVNNDMKKNLEEYVEKLKGMTFQKGMGSVYDKTQRIIKLSKLLSEELNVSDEDVIRTAYLCKADLATNLVFEFTELQGFIGSDYARMSGENEKVVQGIKEHYFPLNAESEIAKSMEGQIVGIADKIDTICAVFASGKKPTGSSDPLGVRRAALGIIKTVIENDLRLNISNLIKSSLELLPVNADCEKDVEEFFVQRLVIYLAEKYSKDVLEACLNRNPLSDVTDYLARVELLSNFDNSMTVENANRISRILKDNSFDTIDEALFNTEEEKNLYLAVKSVVETDDYAQYLQQLVGLNSKIDAFFEKVLVMDKNEAVKNNRIALLSVLRRYYDKIADFSKIK